MMLVIGLSVSSCKKDNDIVLKYQMESKINYSIEFYFYNSSGGLIDVDYTFVKDKQNKLFIPNQTDKVMIYVKHGFNSEGSISYELNNKVDKYQDEGMFIFDKESDNLTYIFNL